MVLTVALTTTCKHYNVQIPREIPTLVNFAIFTAMPLREQSKNVNIAFYLSESQTREGASLRGFLSHDATAQLPQQLLS